MAIAYCAFFKPLFTDPLYRKLSNDAKILYSAMRDRDNLSKKNKWEDENGRFILMPRTTMSDLLNRSLPTIRRVVRELTVVGLLVEKRTGLTKCNHLYIQPLKQEKQAPKQAEQAPKQDAQTAGQADEKNFPSGEKACLSSEGKKDCFPDGKKGSPSNLVPNETDKNHCDTTEGTPPPPQGKNTSKPDWRKPVYSPQPQVSPQTAQNGQNPGSTYQSGQQSGYRPPYQPPPIRPGKLVPAQMYTQRDYANGELQAMIEAASYDALYGEEYERCRAAMEARAKQIATTA
jgi:hypothetical protein